MVLITKKSNIKIILILNILPLRDIVEESNSYLGKFLGDGFGQLKGDFVSYQLPKEWEGKVFLRLRTLQGNVNIEVLKAPRILFLKAMTLEILNSENITIISLSQVSLEIDAVIVSKDSVKTIEINFYLENLNPVPIYRRTRKFFYFKI